ncbi:protein regulator of cytokinesis 1 [Elysia marginata]|uniref:Protein regulator of cytokinesis 1 n=1 Tax=Elysia marginata TaxID=1093978 RepID=A0AAV4FMT5_9GAST|nr:protein regulator of cytokinesis 1 [Elysia marginata]
MANTCREETRLGFSGDTDNFLNTLFQIWEKLGMDDAQKKTRGEAARSHVRTLMQSMITEEETLMSRVEKTIADFTDKLDKLCEELSLPHIRVPADLTMIQKEKLLRTKVELMNKEKNDRLSKYKALHAKDQELCECLNMTPYYLPTGAIPSLQQLKECEKHVNQLQAEKDKRFLQFTATKRKIVDLYNLLEMDPESSFGHDLVCEDDTAFQLSTKNMDQMKDLLESLTMLNDEMITEVEDLWERLRALWNRLEITDIDREAFEEGKKGHGKAVIEALKKEIEACEKLKFENMRKFVDGIRSELKAWWAKCYYSKEQRDQFQGFYEDDCTEELLARHEEELEKMRKYYNTAKELFQKLSHRDELFKKMIVMEEEAHNVNRYKNRGGKLLQEEKIRKKILKDIPKIEEEIAEAVLQWERSTGQEFKLNGLRYPQFIESEWNNFYEHKEQQKQSRLQAKAKQTHDEMLYGSKASISMTPSKRKLQPVNTPVRTPLKSRKINDLTRTPNTTGKLPNSSRFHSTLLSSPFGRKPLYTPKTPHTGPRKRRSIRLMEKAVTERRAATSRRRSRDATFSHTTVSSDDHAAPGLAAHGSYTDFAVRA